MSDVAVAESPLAEPQVGRRASFRLLRRLLRQPVALASAVFLLVVLILAIGGEYVAPHDPDDQVLADKFVPPVWQEGGTWDKPLGTDNLGRDVLSRLMVGGRLSLFIGGAAALGSALIGVPLGMIAGYFKGGVGALIMRLVDLEMSLPALLLIFTVMSAFEPSVHLLIILFALAAWMLFARVVRSRTLSLSETQFIDAAKSMGASGSWIVSRHILPNVAPLIVTIFLIELPALIIGEASVSFLGLGVQPPSITWGLMLAEGRTFVSVAWWTSVMPGLAIFITVLCLTIFAGWLRSEIDPTQREQETPGV